MRCPCSINCRTPKWVVADRGYSSGGFRQHIKEAGAKSAIPSKRTRLKEWRAIATRYETTAASFGGILCLAAALDYLR